MCGFSPPFLWLPDAEYFRDGGWDVELHSDVVDFMVVFDPFPAIDDGDCDFVGMVASMFFSYAAVIGGDDDDGVVVDVCIFEGLDDVSNLLVNAVECVEILWCVMALLVSDVV